GTSTLQAAFLQTPMVVVYKLAPISFFIGRLVVKVKHISLVNIILDYLEAQSITAMMRVKELLQGDANERNITAEVKKIIGNPQYRNEMTAQFKKIAAPFFGKKPSIRAAEIACEIGVEAGV
ncbi:MAG: hypothetical protein L0Y62_03090, partial [Nitrospirae bacterium]|nr:hypothetical protein [Nitrospirota bacterium]